MLQQLLDETSRSLPNIDIEYEKIKERVIDFTARSLDAAFRKYKQQMARWSKYEEVEKKGLEVVLEMRDYIREGERVLDDVRQGGSVAALGNALREVGKRVEHYQSTSS
jgi:adenine/guanine phosphoribosyltransferase-like PRPP-binding protein